MVACNNAENRESHVRLQVYRNRKLFIYLPNTLYLAEIYTRFVYIFV